MKLLGALLLLGSAGYWCLQSRREGMRPLKIGHALLDDLAVFRYQVQICRTPLPDLLRDELVTGPGAEHLWKPLLALLAEEGASLPDCWRYAIQNLPPALRKLLAAIGPLLPAGGDALTEAIEETREELTRYLREETARQVSQGRVTTALSLAGACLLILVLL